MITLNLSWAVQTFLCKSGVTYKRMAKRDDDFILDIIRSIATLLNKWHYREDWHGETTRECTRAYRIK